MVDRFGNCHLPSTQKNACLVIRSTLKAQSDLPVIAMKPACPNTKPNRKNISTLNTLSIVGTKTPE